MATQPTILSQPGNLTPVYNENVYVVQPSGTNWQNAGYKMQVVIKDLSSNVLATLQQPVHPNDGSGDANLLVFDAHRILESYVGYDFGVGTYGVIQNTNSLFGYVVSFQEVWGGVLQGNAVNSNANYVYNAALSWYSYAGYNATTTPWILDTGGSYLTTPTAFNIQLNQTFSLYWLVSDTYFNGFQIITTLDNGAVTSHYFSFTLPVAPQHARFTCGTYDLNHLSGGGTIIPTNAVKYTVQASLWGTPVAALITFNITQECRYDIFRLHFLNKLGGFDGFNFTKINVESTTPTRKTYKKLYGSVNSGVWGYSQSEHGDVVYDTRYKNKVHLTSDWLTDNDMQWLLELIHSPVAYQEVSPTVLRPVNIVDAEYKINKKSFEPLYNLELDVTYSEDNFRQRS